MYNNFKEFNKKIRPYFEKGNYSNNMELFNAIEEKEGFKFIEKEEEEN